MELNNYFTDIYYYLHPTHEQTISHQSIRILQMIQKEQEVTVRFVSDALNISHNTASEHVKKLVKNGWIIKKRCNVDQRKVILELSSNGLLIVKQNTELDELKLQAALNKLSETEKKQVMDAFRLLSGAAK
ncbi:MarR family winged helix-turn-helix transcriptional regulator [Ureibacillus sinduriensis]|uniref:MarR family transcriptional regulator n=1 Tax=Ureibacillus sinduriensis BLB-1 = JCM 15800 TaxID=1384057 RepID=A0A0A3HVC3_9BACL|nr:MarR family transcriptional regulator [Ureibacillus sinduriensis]KGR74253.1 MarR family transcriptional regulator [Ureibacillus sinduriensis BLB-1 = JCM 15800]